MNHYEIVYITNVAQEDRVSNLHSKYQALIDKHQGKVHRFENWGRRQLAYPISKFSHGTYLLYNIEATSDCVKELDHQLRINDSIIRHIIIRCSDAVVEKSSVLKEIESARESLARRAIEKAKESESRANADARSKDSDAKDRNRPKAEPKAQAEAESKTEAEAEPKAEAQAEVESKAEAEVEPKAEAEAKAEPKAEAQAKSESAESTTSESDADEASKDDSTSS